MNKFFKISKNDIFGYNILKNMILGDIPGNVISNIKINAPTIRLSILKVMSIKRERTLFKCIYIILLFNWYLLKYNIGRVFLKINIVYIYCTKSLKYSHIIFFFLTINI